jgi:hypothetical protein
LTPEKEGFGVLTLAADLEGTEILVPRSVRGHGLGFSPHLELIEVLHRDLAIAEPIEQMVSERGREIRPLDLRH